MEAIRDKEEQEEPRTNSYKIVLTRRGSLEVVKTVHEVDDYDQAVKEANYCRRRLKHAKRFRASRKIYDIDIIRNDRFISWVYERR